MDTLSTILNAVWVEGMNLSHKKCVRALVRALLLTLSVNLLKLARAAFSDVRPLSTVRRIERLLAMGIFNVTLLGRAIVNALPPQKRYILTMDRTTWELGCHVYNILALGICYDGISIPVYFTSIPKRGSTNFAEQMSFMERVLEIIPQCRIECLVADREFGYPNFIRWLGFRQIPYCLRLRESTYISDTAGKKGCQARNVLSSLAAGEATVLAHTYIVNGVKVRIYAVRRQTHDSEESLLILATPAESGFTDKIYRLRWQIETSFRAMKTAGFNMEQTHLPLDGRFQSMLAIILIAYACAFIDGLVRIRQRPIPIMKANGRKRFSIFTWGLNMIAADIWQFLLANESGGSITGT